MTPTPSPALPAIIALARSGALDRARRLFDEAGLRSADDAASLSVHGRLLKDEARRAGPDERPRLWREAGDAYARAAALGGDTYPLINAATLALLAGDRPTAEARAGEVLARLQAGDTGPETPYYLEATRAEALLLLGRTEEAAASLRAACALAPEAWEDHASTLRQFSLILETLDEDAGWLAPLQPPRSLHFAGHMGVDDDPALRAAIDERLAAERIGFAFGALAGGADLIVAEAVLARGAELHLVLPASPPVFRAESAAPLGGDWSGRFDAVLDRAASVAVAGSGRDATTMLHIRLAAEIAMGRAVMKAAGLASEAVQLLIADPGADGSATEHIGAHWRAAGRRQLRLEQPRPGDAPPGGHRLPAAPEGGRLAALIAVGLEDDAPAQLARAAAALDGTTPLTPAVVAAEVLHLAFADPLEAGAVAGRIARDGTSRVAAHYGVIRLVDSPFGAPPAAIGAATGVAPDLLASTPPGAIHVSEALAAALHSRAELGPGETAWIGELVRDGRTLGLHALTPPDA
ncbi:MAG: hypothetical protein IR159_04900 [Brevundimonas sp.]|nr:hypothetical protein [Brevundimonas sp.]